VNETMFLAVQRELADPSRRTNRPGRGIHLLSMIGLCHVCGGPLAVRIRRDAGQPEVEEYTCHRSGHVRVPKAELDTYVETYVFGYLTRDDVCEALSVADEGNAEALEVAEVKVERIKAEMLVIEGQVERLEMPAASAGRLLLGLDKQLKEAEKRAKELRTPSRLVGMIEPGPNVAKRWKDAPMSTRRATAKMLFSREMLGELRITRAPSPGHRSPVGERVIFRNTSE
jgi:site-specific DNA recombinase